jgi:hypothetical protein
MLIYELIGGALSDYLPFSSILISIAMGPVENEPTLKARWSISVVALNAIQLPL